MDACQGLIDDRAVARGLVSPAQLTQKQPQDPSPDREEGVGLDSRRDRPQRYSYA